MPELITQPDLLLILGAATDACRLAGHLLRAGRRAGRFKVASRARHDVKLDADRRAECAIVRSLRARRPMDGVIAEEQGGSKPACDGAWVVDPLDGTVNYSHGHPHFCVSIAWMWRSRVAVAAIYDPLRDEMFTATYGGGARCNGRPIRCSAEPALNRALLATGFGSAAAEEQDVAVFKTLLEIVQRARISGSAALDLAYVACGRLDAYYESRVYLWDIAAGMLLVTEAGGRALSVEQSGAYAYACLASNAGLERSLHDHVSLETSRDA